MAGQEVQLRRRLDTLGDDCHAESVGERGRAAHDCRVVAIDPAMLKIELTESTAMRDTERVARLL